jgi:hypothetical protein
MTPLNYKILRPKCIERPKTKWKQKFSWRRNRSQSLILGAGGKKTKSAIAEAENRNFRNFQKRYITYRRSGQGPKNFSRNKLTLVTIHDESHPTVTSVLSDAVRSVFIAITSPSTNIKKRAVDPEGAPFFPLKW